MFRKIQSKAAIVLGRQGYPERGERRKQAWPINTMFSEFLLTARAAKN